MGAPPSGTMTFLFTDIEGSTQLWERSPDQMRPALARHDRVLRAAVESHDGYVVKTTGDGIHAAFGDPLAAVLATVDGQRALLREQWDETGPLRVRMGVHTGEAEAREGDYYGQSLNRAARLMAAGHGGQVLLSRSTEELVRGRLPPDIELRDLGERRLKDLIRPEHLFQVVAVDLPASFPALKTLDARPNNLPAQPTPLVGREGELAELTALLGRSDVRLATLTGPGGTGKTRLALQVAADLVDEFEHGVTLVELSAIRDPGLVASAIAEALGLMETSVRDLAQVLREHLRTRQLLLVIDNFEQVVSAAPLLVELLAASPRLKIVVTSQWLLRLRGEHEFQVPPLGVPEAGGRPSVEDLVRSEAVRLFVERAQAARPDFALSDENARAVVEVCRRLEGLPLAIELAAARIRILPPAALLARLDDRLAVLAGGARDLPERQRALRAAIAWSYDLLDAAERTLLARLSVFAGGATLEAAEAVCGPGSPIDMLDGISSLVEKSLFRSDAESEAPRFAMLATIRDFALERLLASAEADEIRSRHAAYFRDLGETAAPGLKGALHASWFARLDREHDNMRAALSWLRGRGDADVAARLGVALGWFWLVRGHLTEGRAQLEAILAMPSASVPTRTRAELLQALAELLRAKGDHDASRSALDEALAISRRKGDGAGVALALIRLGHLELDQGHVGSARPPLEEALVAARAAGDKVLAAWSLYRLATLDLIEGDTAAARARVTEALALREALGDSIEAAESYVVLGFASGAQGDDDAALSAFQEALRLLRKHPPTLNVTFVLEGIARIAAARGDEGRAIRLAAAAQALREAVGEQAPPFMSALVASWLEPARQRLGADASAAAWADGRAMTRDGAIDHALATAEDPLSTTAATTVAAAT